MTLIEAWVSPGVAPSERMLRVYVDGADASGVRIVRLIRQADGSVIRTFERSSGDFGHCQLTADLASDPIDQTIFPIVVAAEYCDEQAESVVVEALIPLDDVASPRSPGGCRPGTRPTMLWDYSRPPARSSELRVNA